MDAAIGLPEDDIDNVEGLIQVGEWLVAFETLCTQIYEWDISLPADVIGDLEDLGFAIGAAKGVRGRPVGGCPRGVGRLVPDQHVSLPVHRYWWARRR